MTRRNAAAILLTTATLALTGCGGAAPAESEATSSTPSPTPTPKTYTNEELTSIVAGLKDAQGQPLTVIPAEQINQGLITAREMLKSAVINPPACSVLADNNSQVPEGSTYAGGATQSAADKTATIITVFAVQDPAVMTDQLEKSKSALDQCANFTVEAKGQQIAFQLQPLDAKTSGDESISALSNQTLPDGQKATSVTVTGVKGTLAATAVKAGPSLTGDAAAELVQLVDAVLAKG
jgi:hypothetical protein